MEKKRNPKLVVEVNKPVTIELAEDKPFWSGENEFGKSYAYNVLVGGEPHTFFANEQAHDQINGFQKGSQLNLLWKEIKNEGKKPYRVWEIRQAMFDDNGRQAHATDKPDIVNDKEARDSVMGDMENLMYSCLKSAERVVHLFNVPEAGNPDDFLPPTKEFALNREDVRTIGISMFIELRKRYS